MLTQEGILRCLRWQLARQQLIKFLEARCLLGRFLNDDP